MRYGIALFWLATAGAVACSSASGNGSSGAALGGGVGKVCASASDCASGLDCRSDTTDWIAHHQCTTTCNTDADCTGAYGPKTQCIGANICVLTCQSAADCPSGTICNDFGWCEHSGPGSGVPVCSGTPEPCSLLDEASCSGALGCLWDGCSGIGPSCYSQFSSYSCSSIDGCFWDSYSSSCTGSATPCDLQSSEAGCVGETGCSWSGCSGVQEKCESNPPSLCKDAPGCALAFQ